MKKDSGLMEEYLTGDLLVWQKLIHILIEKLLHKHQVEYP